MTPEKNINREMVVMNKLGLHARSAALLVKIANRFSCEILIQRDESKISAKSIMGLLTLSASPGTSLQVTARGRDAEEAIEAIEELFENKFYEE